MSERLPIPAELRRRVLFEAGHRCAIHTCRNEQVDIHHIVPWSQVRKHRFDNLIALCPNCHRRADEGHIDRLSLRLYKARLAAALCLNEMNSYPRESESPADFAWLDPQGQWSSRELVRQGAGIEVGLEYPQFRGRMLGAATAFVNRYIRQRMKATLSEFLVDGEKSPIQSSIPKQLHSSFFVSLLRSSIVSMRITMSAYTGGAHSSQWAEALNFFVTPVREFGITDIFQDWSLGLGALSAYVIDELLKPSKERPARDEEHVRRGAGPDPKNYSAFNLTLRGVLITFDEYQVGCYAEGPSEVHVPYSVVAPWMKPALIF